LNQNFLRKRKRVKKAKENIIEENKQRRQTIQNQQKINKRKKLEEKENKIEEQKEHIEEEIAIEDSISEHQQKEDDNTIKPKMKKKKQKIEHNFDVIPLSSLDEKSLRGIKDSVSSDQKKQPLNEFFSRYITLKNDTRKRITRSQYVGQHLKKKPAPIFHLK